MLGESRGVEDREGVAEPVPSAEGLDMLRDTLPAFIASVDERGEDVLDWGFLSSFSWTLTPKQPIKCDAPRHRWAVLT